MVDAITPPRMTLDLPPAEHAFDTLPRPIDMLLSAMRSGDTGTVDRDRALSVAAVLRARNEICSISTLPLRLFKGLDVVNSPLFRQFDPDVANVVHMALTVEDLLFEKIAWWQKLGLDFDGFPAMVRRIDPCKVSLTEPGKGSRPGSTIVGVPPLQQPAQQPTGRYVWIDYDDGRGPVPVLSSLMIRFDSPNPGTQHVLARIIRIAILLDRLIEMYADNPQLKELFSDNPDNDDEAYTEDESAQFIAEWSALRKMSPVAWVPSQVKRLDFTAPSPKDLTLVDLRQEVNLAIANGLGVDPEDLGVSTTSRTYFNSIDKKTDKINRTYAPYMEAITGRLAMGDVTPRGQAPQFDLTNYLKGAPAEQAAYWAQLRSMGVVDAEWIGEQAGVPSAVTRRAQSTAAPAVDAPPNAGAAVQNARPLRLVASRNFDGIGVAHTFDARDFDAPPAAPTVDESARTITGLAVPYGAIADKYGLKITFDPGSLEYSEPARMAHLQDHVTPVGFHRSITETAAGPMVALAVLDGPAGSSIKADRDQLLYDAANGLYTGLSVGVDYSLDPEDGDVTVDDAGVVHVVRATWRETSSTYMPAFDDARVTRVAASRNGGNPVDPCQHCGRPHAPNIACATFAAHLATQPAPAPQPQPAPAPQPQPAPDAQYAAFMAWQQAQAPAPAPALPAGPTAVNPHNAPVAQVTEALPYRYDRRGNLRAAQYDFSGDISIAYNPNYQGDQPRDAADNRIKAWLQYAFGAGDLNAERHLGRIDPPAAGQQFAITPANVVNLNYPQNHPEMYVDQLDFLYPMYEAFNKGTLDAVTPFVLPKFSASSGLVADHVSGTEPTPGAFTATAQTITPSPLSGKVEMLRETFDQGGNPQASGLIWRQIVRGWYEGIEAAIQAFFVANAASIPDIALGTAVTDAAMDQALAAAITALQYIRGGDRFSKVFTQIDLYQKLGKAVDTTNRPLYPTFGSMNTSGSMAPDQNYLNVRGKTFAPAWATAASGSIAASSWMMDPDVVGVWLSTPQRLDIVWRVAWVDIGVFGYKALAITDFTRTRELIYDPV